VRDVAKGRAVASEIGGRSEVRELDVANLGSIRRFTQAWVGPIDVLINNAGIMSLALIAEESDQATARQIAINLTAVIHGTREAIVRMQPRGSGHIVNIASLAGKLGAAGGATYCASKHGVVGLSEAAHAELRGTGVEISCVLPTIVTTELAAGLKRTGLSSQLTPDDVAAAILDVLRHPRPEVFVPRRMGPLDRVIRVLPRRFGQWLLRRTGSDQLLASAVHASARDDYERRAAASAPGAAHGAVPLAPPPGKL
jgi:short-subunit dehydrogenase